MKVVYLLDMNQEDSALTDFKAKFICAIKQDSGEDSYLMIFKNEWENQGGE